MAPHNLPARELLPPEIANNESIYPPQDVMEKLQIFVDLGRDLQPLQQRMDAHQNGTMSADADDRHEQTARPPAAHVALTFRGGRMQGILRIESASKSFQAPEGGVIRALDNVSLTVAHNEFLTLLGPSGCGKTTLLRAVSGFEDLDGWRDLHRRPTGIGSACTQTTGQHRLSKICPVPAPVGATERCLQPRG